MSFPGEQQHVRYGEGVMVGYRYHATVGRSVRYPFGHGLSYASIESSDLADGADQERRVGSLDLDGDHRIDDP